MKIQDKRDTRIHFYHSYSRKRYNSPNFFFKQVFNKSFLRTPDSAETISKLFRNQQNLFAKPLENEKYVSAVGTDGIISDFDYY